MALGLSSDDLHDRHLAFVMEQLAKFSTRRVMREEFEKLFTITPLMTYIDQLIDEAYAEWRALKLTVEDITNQLDASLKVTFRMAHERKNTRDMLKAIENIAKIHGVIKDDDKNATGKMGLGDLVSTFLVTPDARRTPQSS